jgi:hypothetical protein
VGGLTSALKGLARGEISELSKMIYEARENALKKIADEATRIGADDVLGIRTYVYQLGNGVIEFMAMGTAVKKNPNLRTQSDQLLPQAIIRDKDTFFNTAEQSIGTNLNQRER